MLPEIYAREILRGLQRESGRQAPYTRIIISSPAKAKGILRATGSALTRLGQRLESWASHPVINAAAPVIARPASSYATHAGSHPNLQDGQ
jgi:hypothetical protein